MREGIRSVWIKIEDVSKQGPWLTGMLVLVAICALIFGLLAWREVPNPGLCTEDRKHVLGNSSPTRAFPANSQQPLSHTVAIIDATQTKVQLGRGAGPARTAIELRTDTVSAPLNQVDLSVQSFRRGNDPNFTQAVVAWAQFKSPQLITLYLCFERSNDGNNMNNGKVDRFKIDPGEYAGTVLITDSRLPETTVPFTLDIAYNNEFIVILLWLAVIPVGGAYLMVLRRPPDLPAEKVNWKNFDQFISNPADGAAIIAGAVASFGIYESVYLSSDVWGSSSIQWFALIGAMFAAFVAAGTTFRFAANIKDTQNKGAQGAGG